MSGLPDLPAAQPRLREALIQILGHPGSMVRAQMAYEIGTHYGVEASAAQNLAISVEYFHTASLIFDDLPCMDDATKRRGEICVHRQFGEATAILASLGLINRAYALAWKAILTRPVEYRQAAADYLEACLGIAGVLSGQSEDLHYAKLFASERVPHEVALLKTVPLVRLSLVLPALLGGASPSDRLQLERISKFWGLSYQLIDDLKDISSRPEASSKTIGRDKLFDRPNEVLTFGAKVATRRLKVLLLLGDRSLRRLEKGGPPFSYLKQLRGRFVEELAVLQAS